jgi:hypothetical protein
MSRKRLYNIHWVLGEKLRLIGGLKSTSPEQAVKDWKNSHPEARESALCAISANQICRKRRSSARKVCQYEFQELPLTALNGGDPDWPATRGPYIPR